MKVIKLIKVLFCLFLLFPVSSPIFANPAYYRKHIVLVIDQTPKTQGEHLLSIGDKLLMELKNNDFDPKQDLLEIFLYGMEGNVSRQPFYGKAYQLKLESNDNNVSNDSLFEHTIDYLVHNYKCATDFGDLDRWWKNELNDIFTGKTDLAKSISGKSGYGLSAFLPDAVIPFIDRSIPAQEYSVICVSTFQAGLSGQMAGHDLDILSDIYGNKYKAQEFEKWLRQKSSIYQISNGINISKGTAQDKGVSAIEKHLVLKSAAKTSVHITSNISLKQKEYGVDTYIVKPITISFPKDESLDIKSIKLTINDEGGNEIFAKDIINFNYDQNKMEYEISLDEIQIKDLEEDSKYAFKIFFTPDLSADSDVLPYIFITNREITGGDIEFSPTPMRYITETIVVILAITITICLLLLLIYRKRGEKVEAKIKLNVWPISNSRYMDVSDNKVVNNDCWYYREGEREKHIQVSGSINTTYPTFAYNKFKLVAEYQVQDIDLNEDFSFRPKGKTFNGDNKEKNTWYPLKLDGEGNFEFEIISYLNDNVSCPNFNREDKNILRVMVVIRSHFETSSGKRIGKTFSDEKRYYFIVRPEIQNSDVWVSFDPGTSGSCIAYGWGGLPASTDNIHLACSHSTNTAGNNVVSPIFYSKIQIMDHSKIFNGEHVDVEQLEVFDSNTGHGDFRFGNEAHIFWGRNSFQSIKKLLGYSNKLEIKNSKGRVTSIKGEDLAHLLIKGLCHEFTKYVKNSTEVDPIIKSKLITNNRLSPSRAIVAVPNNYTVNKVQAMVDTIKRTKFFKEIHYVYEAEGVMMYYMNQEWSKLASLKDKTFVVFDMGGATINATSFRMNVITGNHNGNIYTKRISVDTVSRIGYTVGGDNIDFALINVILGIPSVEKALLNAYVNKNDLMRKQKKRLISFVQKLKLDYIEKITGTPSEGNWVIDENSLWTQIFKLLNTDCNIVCPEAMDTNDKKYLNSDEAKGIINKLVFDCVKDAVEELITDRFSSEIILIPSGRSILFPGIKDAVIDTLTTSGFEVKEWDYNKSENLQEIVKTAVVRGACWYAMHSKYIELRHDSVTSTFGYIDQVNNEVKFIPVIEKNTDLDDYGQTENVVAPMDPTISSIKFVQMLGSNYDEIYRSEELLHKMAELTQIPPSQISGTVKSIKIKVDSNNNFNYEINVAGENEPISGTCKMSDVDITDKNSEAYAFAALSTLDDELTSENDALKNKTMNSRSHLKKNRF